MLLAGGRSAAAVSTPLTVTSFCLVIVPSVVTSPSTVAFDRRNTEATLVTEPTLALAPISVAALPMFSTSENAPPGSSILAWSPTHSRSVAPSATRPSASARGSATASAEPGSEGVWPQGSGRSGTSAAIPSGKRNDSRPSAIPLAESRTSFSTASPV